VKVAEGIRLIMAGGREEQGGGLCEAIVLVAIGWWVMGVADKLEDVPSCVEAAGPLTPLDCTYTPGDAASCDTSIGCIYQKDRNSDSCASSEATAAPGFDGDAEQLAVDWRKTVDACALYGKVAFVIGCLKVGVSCVPLCCDADGESLKGIAGCLGFVSRSSRPPARMRPCRQSAAPTSAAKQARLSSHPCPSSSLLLTGVDLLRVLLYVRVLGHQRTVLRHGVFR
jgi:hypothetical protein